MFGSVSSSHFVFLSSWFWRRCIYNPKNTFCAKNNAEHCSSENGVSKVRRAREEHAKNTRIARQNTKNTQKSVLRLQKVFCVGYSDFFICSAWFFFSFVLRVSLVVSLYIHLFTRRKVLDTDLHLDNGSISASEKTVLWLFGLSSNDRWVRLFHKSMKMNSNDSCYYHFWINFSYRKISQWSPPLIVVSYTFRR